MHSLAAGQPQEPEKAAGSSEREALLARLQSAVVADGKGAAGDADLLAGAVKALQDATALEGQVSKLKQVGMQASNAQVHLP